MVNVDNAKNHGNRNYHLVITNSLLEDEPCIDDHNDDLP